MSIGICISFMKYHHNVTCLVVRVILIPKVWIFPSQVTNTCQILDCVCQLMCIFRVQVVACQMSKKLSQTLSKIHIAYTYTQVSMARSRSNSLLHTICTTYLDFLIQERASSSKSLEPSVLYINISMRDP